MSEIVRVIALAIVTFFVTAVVLVLSNPELTHVVLMRLGIDPGQEARVETGRATEALVPGERVFTVQHPQPGTLDRPHGLSLQRGAPLSCAA